MSRYSGGHRTGGLGRPVPMLVAACVSIGLAFVPCAPVAGQGATVTRQVQFKYDGADGFEVVGADGGPVRPELLALPLGATVTVKVSDPAKKHLVAIWQYTDRWTTETKRGKDTIITRKTAYPVQDQYVALGNGVEILTSWTGADDAGNRSVHTTKLTNQPLVLNRVYPGQLDFKGTVDRSGPPKEPPPLSSPSAQRTGPSRIGPAPLKSVWYTITVTIQR